MDDARRHRPAAPVKRLGLPDGVLDQRCLLDHVAMFFPVGVGYAQQHAAEARPSIMILRREVRSPIERFAAGSEKGGQRPSPLSTHSLYGGLVAAVNVG